MPNTSVQILYWLGLQTNSLHESDGRLIVSLYEHAKQLASCTKRQQCIKNGSHCCLTVKSIYGNQHSVVSSEIQQQSMKIRTIEKCQACIKYDASGQMHLSKLRMQSKCTANSWIVIITLWLWRSHVLGHYIRLVTINNLRLHQAMFQDLMAIINFSRYVLTTISQFATNSSKLLEFTDCCIATV